MECTDWYGLKHTMIRGRAIAREADQGLEARLEDQFDREGEPALTRSVSPVSPLTQAIVPLLTWVPAFAGMVFN
jgi:hypothetical protein